MKSFFGFLAVVFTVIGVCGILLVGLVGIIWGPLCLTTHMETRSHLGCGIIVRDLKTAIALLVCGVVVLSLGVIVITVECLDRKNEEEKNQNTMNNAENGNRLQNSGSYRAVPKSSVVTMSNDLDVV